MADPAADYEAQRAKQAENNAKAAEVMETSTPWPTQEIADKAKLGILEEGDLDPPEQPEMPSLEEQRKVETTTP